MPLDGTSTEALNDVRGLRSGEGRSALSSSLISDNSLFVSGSETEAKKEMMKYTTGIINKYGAI